MNHVVKVIHNDIVYDMPHAIFYDLLSSIALHFRVPRDQIRPTNFPTM